MLQTEYENKTGGTIINDDSGHLGITNQQQQQQQQQQTTTL